MDKHLVVIKAFSHEVSWCCPGESHQHVITFHQGDVWTLTDERKYIDSLGWHSLMDVNREFQCFISTEELQDLYLSGVICSILDVDLQMNHLNFKINEALDTQNRELFHSMVSKRFNLQKIRDKVDAIYAQIV
ncbi:hypothetical protein [Priestia flexa]|uniref:hypothetical protein n=1 Tax=Priestia flexa TaxID=86664 RepID=UPI0010FBC575|nr:hypothetical protein [Priestia flexa]QCS54035.1 hypothetical protein FED53_16265 [Priestia flexa]